MSASPAPWRIESYQAHSGMVVWEIRDALGASVAACHDKDTAERVVRCRNAASDLDGLKAITDAYQGAIDALKSDVEQVRARWHEEVATLGQQLERYREEIAALKKEKGLLL